ncbi:CBS domain-containing protein [Synechococcus sp. ROS8604]|uniref:CBS domain-containing protein n=1 Tax=Synechococcus sp. ROS8604 TaxID=1442557 RepID=UPI0016472F6D|nr:CBS domain-containing protein [Synechococcus sp. ROS8604]QNI88975.1 CBS domains-containing protein [Synechococcus sp. ROS8604]
MVLQQTVKEVMSSPVLTVTPETALKDAVSLLSDHHISGLPVVDQSGVLIGELTEQDLMVRESGVDAGPYVMLLDSVIYLKNPLNWDKQVHQVLGTTVSDLMGRDLHSCAESLPLRKAASLLHERSTQRLIVVDDNKRPVGVLTRGDIVRALASGQP